MEADIYQFRLGQTFENYDLLKLHFQKFCEVNYQPFVIRNHSIKQVVYKCCHGVQRKSKSKGERPNQHYYFKGCGAQINLFKNKDNKWKVTKTELHHNHVISKEDYRLHHRTDNLNDGLVTDLVLAVLGEQNEYSDNPTSSNIEGKSLTDMQKFNMAFSTAKNIAEALSHHGTERFLNYMEELKTIESNARQGLPLLNNCLSGNEMFVFEESPDNKILLEKKEIKEETDFILE